MEKKTDAEGTGDWGLVQEKEVTWKFNGSRVTRQETQNHTTKVERTHLPG